MSFNHYENNSDGNRETRASIKKSLSRNRKKKVFQSNDETKTLNLSSIAKTSNPNNKSSLNKQWHPLLNTNSYTDNPNRSIHVDRQQHRDVRIRDGKIPIINKHIRSKNIPKNLD